jgi:hypothetical protein
VDLVVVITVHLGSKDLAGIFDGFDVFSGTGSDEPILEPAIRPFDFAFGLRRERIARLDVTVPKDPFPLWVHIIGDQIMFSPDGIPALDEAENRVAVGVIGIGSAIAQNHAFQGRDVVPTGLFFNQLGVQQLTAVIIEAGDEIPLVSGIGRPLVMGGIMLDEFADVIGQDFPVMGLPFRPAKEKVMFFSPFDNRRDRDLLSMLLPKKIPDITVVIVMDGDIRVFDQSFLPAQLMKDVFLDLWADGSGFLSSLIGDRKLRRVLAVVFQQNKESASADLKDVEDIPQLNLFVDVTLKQGPDLLVTERPVELFDHS